VGMRFKIRQEVTRNIAYLAVEIEVPPLESTVQRVITIFFNFAWKSTANRPLQERMKHRMVQDSRIFLQANHVDKIYT